MRTILLTPLNVSAKIILDFLILILLIASCTMSTANISKKRLSVHFWAFAGFRRLWRLIKIHGHFQTKCWDLLHPWNHSFPAPVLTPILTSYFKYGLSSLSFIRSFDRKWCIRSSSVCSFELTTIWTARSIFVHLWWKLLYITKNYYIPT